VVIDPGFEPSGRVVMPPVLGVRVTGPAEAPVVVPARGLPVVVLPVDPAPAPMVVSIPAPTLDDPAAPPAVGDVGVPGFAPEVMAPPDMAPPPVALAPPGAAKAVVERRKAAAPPMIVLVNITLLRVDPIVWESNRSLR